MHLALEKLHILPSEYAQMAPVEKAMVIASLELYGEAKQREAENIGR